MSSKLGGKIDFESPYQKGSSLQLALAYNSNFFTIHDINLVKPPYKKFSEIVVYILKIQIKLNLFPMKIQYL